MKTFPNITALTLLTAVAGVISAQPPVPLPPRIQINGATRGVVTKSFSISGDQRKISVTQDGETIAIEDKAGKDITVRRTREVNGEKKSEEFKAPDIDTLKKNHPEAAELYNKHIEGVQTAEQARAQLQIQIQQRLNGGDPFGMPRNGLSRRGQGTRQITSTSKGKLIEIDDRYGEKIVIKITDQRSAEPKTRTIEADDLSDLEAKDAEAARHYKRLTAES